MNTVVTLVERGGSARSLHVDGNRIPDIAPILRANLSREAKLMTDEHQSYRAWFTARMNTFAATCTPIRSKATIRSSSAV
jgi:hypothetical protein